MDPGKQMEEQFSKLHPCFPINTRIGIIGAGPGGLSAAYALSKLGYCNVTVLEKCQSVGGMCESVEIEGRIYDLGGQVLATNSAPTIFHLAKEIEAEQEEMDSHKFAIIDSSTGRYKDMKVVDDYVSIISLTLKLQDEAKASGRTGVHAVSDIASDVTPAFLEGHGFKSVPKSVAYGYTASGYGFTQDMPYAYFHEFTRTSMAGKALEHIPMGFYYFGEFMDDPAAIGHPVAMQRFYADTDVFLFWSYGNSIDIRGPKIIELAINAAKSMGVMKEGFYDKLELELQGQHSTYYVGGLLAFELTETNSSYAMALVCKHFASDRPLPKFPYVKGLDFIDAFFGCLRARVIPVPAIPPDPFQRGRQALIHINSIANSCNAVAILSTFGYHTSVRAVSMKNMILNANKKCSLHWPDLPWLHTDSWIKNYKNVTHPEVINGQYSEPLPDELCFLQYTSGSTGDAKGVMITHGGLIHNVKLMRKRYRSTSRTVLVSWLPQYHDMGLIGGLFTTLVTGGSAILFSPTTFIKKPLLWLQAMSKYRATHSAGPNFAFELIVRRLESNKDEVQNFDLSSMVFLMVAAEPVRPKTLKRFIEITRPFGLSQEVMAPGYGLAENCVYVSSAFGEGQPILVDWQGRVCCGYVDPNDPDIDIRIVNPDTGMNFQNHLGKKYIRTGDLGRNINDKLFITGRIKDLIIVAGRNIYSSDVEKTVESSSEFLRPGCCAVVGVPEETLLAKGISIPEGSDQVGLVVIAEVREEKHFPKEVIEQIQNRVVEEHGIAIASVVLIKQRTICKTSSGKIKRYECLKQFIEGTLDVIKDSILEERSSVQSMRKACQPQVTRNLLPTNPNMCKQEIVDFLKGLLSEQTGISIANISITESLVSYGIDSIGVVRAAQKLSDFLGVPVGAIDIFTATCIEDLAHFAEDLLMKSRPHFMTPPSYLPETKENLAESITEVSMSRKLFIWIFQLLALSYASAMLIIPAYISVSAYTTLTSASHILIDRISWFGYFIPLACAPLAWIFTMISTCVCIAFFGNTFLQPNYALNPEISIWSADFVKWWALYKAQEVSSKVLAVHLRGTVFLKYWFEMLGARIGSSVLLDTIDMTDPSLVSIGDGAVIAEGALIQSHEVKNGVLSFCPARIGQNSSIGPYAVIQKGSVVGDGAEVQALQISKGGKIVSTIAKTDNIQKIANGQHHQFRVLFPFNILVLFAYVEPFIGCHSPLLHIQLCLAVSPQAQATFAISVAIAYLVHGLIFCFFAWSLTSILSRQEVKNKTHLNTWLRHRIIIACHMRFAKFLSGTEAFCMYFRLLGAKIGKHCSMRAINPVSDPELISIADGVHLGDFSRIIPGFYTSSGFVSRKIEVQDNSVVGSQSLILPGSVIEKNVVLGALSVAPMDSVLQKGGVFVGSQKPVMVKNSMHTLDDRVEEMDVKYKKVLGNLASNFAASTLKVRSRYFHRIGASGKGFLRLYTDIPGLPDHKIFSPGKNYPIILRHSNCLSSDDDARIDPRGAAIRILSDRSVDDYPLLDLTLKTGKAFHARTIGDFATWLVCGVAAREEHVKYAPHLREAMWDSLRRAESYTELHYYSNICRLFRFKDGQEMYVKFKLRPFDEKTGEDSGKVEPMGILPPETGAIARDDKDTRPLLFLAEDFQRRVNSLDGVRYVLQLQIQPVPQDESNRDTALDCTKPWDKAEFPYIDVGEITIDQLLTKEESEELEFNPFRRCPEVDVIRARSCSQSASLDHGRSIIYEICQHLRNRKPLPEAWRIFLDQSDVKVDLSGCPMAAALEGKDAQKVTLARTWYQTLWLMSAQPLLQIILPYFLLGLVIFTPLNWVLYMKESKKLPLHWLLPLFWVCSGILAGLACVVAKWILVGKNKEGEALQIWSKRIFMDTIWQAIRTLVGEYFMEMTSGSALFGLWMKLMGSDIHWDQGVYVDSMGAVLNPEMVRIEKHGSVGKEALLFGHIYEGEGGKVKFGNIRIEKGGFVGTRACGHAWGDCGEGR
ncbi:hypothetical protein F0562_001418 [Nyssa sinensis]|uniref:Carrier domain-containing protein n=1 Tax=Nyssa sinensis TaxID=561372 RepID=A0A5J5C425_9ASTE|nr:hypothetical protein F0562_001418 [Nyssa sinensis]